MTQEIVLRIMNTNLLMNPVLANTKLKNLKQLEWEAKQPIRDAELAAEYGNKMKLLKPYEVLESEDK